MENSETYVTEEIGRLKERIGQISKKKPWYKIPSNLVSLIALTLSIVTSFYSFTKAQHDDYVSSRLELRTLLTNMIEMNQDFEEVKANYKDTPEIIGFLSAHYNTKNAILSKQSMAVVDRLENSKLGENSVLDVEYVAIGHSLLNSQLVSDAKRFFDNGILRATDSVTLAGAIRSRAQISLLKNDIGEMRGLMHQALEIYENPEYMNDPLFLKNMTNGSTYLQWAEGEALAGYCNMASEIVLKLNSLLLNASDNLRSQLGYRTPYVNGLIQKCKTIKDSTKKTTEIDASS
jgi:hypothetical protein